MRASTARLMNSPVRLADLTFPQVNRLIHRTRLAFIHLDNLLAFGKRDRDGRVDGYITAHLPDECLLVFLRKGEAVNAASLHPSGRHVVTITEALNRMRAEVERGDLAYCAAPMEQLAWMYQSCAVPLQPRAVDAAVPVAFAEGEEVVEVDEGEAGAMNQPVHLRERQVREANRRIHQASGARAHGPPRRMLRQMLLDLLHEDRLRVRAHQRIHVPPVLEE